MNALLPDYHSNNKNQRQNIVRTREYQLSNVKFLEELGEGAFGNIGHNNNNNEKVWK